MRIGLGDPVGIAGMQAAEQLEDALGVPLGVQRLVAPARPPHQFGVLRLHQVEEPAVRPLAFAKVALQPLEVELELAMTAISAHLLQDAPQ